MIQLNENYFVVEAQDHIKDGYSIVGEINLHKDIPILKTPILGLHLGVVNLLNEKGIILKEQTKYLLLKKQPF
jgi:hypothetical protein